MKHGRIATELTAWHAAVNAAGFCKLHSIQLLTNGLQSSSVRSSQIDYEHVSTRRNHSPPYWV